MTDDDGNKVLMQKIAESTHAEEWGSTPSPVTNFGDDRWFNYSVSADVKFADSGEPDKNSTAVGLRYNLADSGASGWRLQLNEAGEWRLRIGTKPVATGNVKLNDGWNRIKIEAVYNTIRGYVNGELVTEITVPAGILGLRPGLFRNMTRVVEDRLGVPSPLVRT